MLDFTGLLLHCLLVSCKHGGSAPWGTLCSGAPGIAGLSNKAAATQHEHGGERSLGHES